MELKHIGKNTIGDNDKLLIVPYGIETQEALQLILLT